MRTNRHTEGDSVNFALDLNGTVLTLVDVDTLFHLRLTDHQVSVVLLKLLQYTSQTHTYIF